MPAAEKSTSQTRPRYDLQELKNAATGQWQGIMHRVAGVPLEFLSGNHCPCPKCGGTKDRFRVFKDFDETGGAVCSGSCKKMADGFAFLETFLGCSFSKALELVANHLGVQPKAIATRGGEDKTPTDFTKHLELKGFNEQMAAVWCAIYKKPITTKALLDFGAQYGLYRKKYPVFALPIRGQQSETVGWTLYHATGQKLPVFTKGHKEPTEWVKIKVLSGSKAGWIGPLPKPTDKLIWKTEGQSCALAIYSAMQEHAYKSEHTVCCNAFGAEENPASNPWMLDRFKGIEEVFVVHDLDKSGQSGATEVINENGTSRPGWAPAIANFAKLVRNYVLPGEMTDSHGYDMRDNIIHLLGEGYTYGEAYQHSLSSAQRANVVTAIPVKGLIVSSSGEAVASDCEIESPADPHRLARINIDSYRDQSGGELRYYKNSWYKWRVGKWQNIADSDLRAKVSVSIRKQFEADQKLEYAIWEESPKEGEPPPKIRHVTRNLTNNVIAAMEGMCIVPSSIEMPTWLDDRQSKPYIAFENGLLDYDKVFARHEDAMKPPSHLWFSLSTIPYFFDKNARCDRWQEFLADVLESDQERLDLLQEWFGYLLLPDTRFQKALISEGSGSNGKTVVNAGATAMLGEGNISNLCIDDFANKFALGSTYGKMLNISADLGTVDQVAEGTLKQFIGGDRIFVDRKNREPMSIRPTCKLMASWNDRPKIRDRSNGIWRRLIIMPFRVTVDESRAIKGMDSPAYWRDEAPGICNWALVGLYRLLNQGRFTKSDVCNEASKSYRTESSPVAMFLSECIVSESKFHIESKVLYERYLQWSRENGYERVSDARIVGKEVQSMFSIARRRSSEPGRPWVYDDIAFNDQVAKS